MRSIISFLLLVAVVHLNSCKGLRLTREICFVVRDGHGKLVNKRVKYELVKDGQVVKGGQSNPIGVFKLSRKELQRAGDFRKQVIRILDDNKKELVRDTLNYYMPIYDLYTEARKKVVPESERVADMHYHASMRTHNLYADQFYSDGKNKKPPGNLNWMKWYKKLCVYDNGKWCKVRNITKESETNLRRTRILLEGKWVMSQDGANNLKHFSEATFPHLRDGQVYLGYNAISPFEHSVSNEGIKRALSSSFKTGAPIAWLQTMGFKGGKHFSHWKNFTKEYDMITHQNQRGNNFRWTYLKKDSVLQEDIPTIVNVVEGGHILQDKYFPHFINYNLTDSTSSRTRDERDKQLYCYLRNEMDYFVPGEVKRLDVREVQKEFTPKERWALWDRVLFGELNKSIAEIKKKDIFMIAIGHLSYNGMVGHSPALDVSKRPFFFEGLVSRVLRRAYGTRTSNDRRYRKAFDGIFYRVPGVNYFGDSVITQLLRINNGGRIQIDLKHSDPVTRRIVLNRYQEFSAFATKDEEKLRPICSHCAVNGLPMDFASPLTNEYQLMTASIVRKFYPFSINLYNEEVETICERDGIIGIPLEERVLGGYIDNNIWWPRCIIDRKKTAHDESKPDEDDENPKKDKNRYQLDSLKDEYSPRFSYLKKALGLTRQDSVKEYLHVVQFYRKQMHRDNISFTAGDTTKMSTAQKESLRYEKLKELIQEEYLDAEPFLQNLFHIVDLAYRAKKKLKIDTLVSEQLAVVDSATKVVRLSNKQFVPAEIKGKVETQAAIAERRLKEMSWDNICIGSDLDGLIDPLDICPTASHYPFFKEKLKVFIPLFLYLRQTYEPRDPYLDGHRVLKEYFDSDFTIQKAMDKVFYLNLKNFTIHISKQR